MLSRLITALHLRDLDAGAVIDILVLAFIIYQLLSLIRGRAPCRSWWAWWRWCSCTS